VIRLVYSSLTTPESVVDQHLGTYERSVKKMEKISGNFDGTQYKSERTWASSWDGTKIPISLVYRMDCARHDGTDPILLEVFGANGVSFNPRFSVERLSLMERGIVYGILHVRGGGELGR